jgi:hypothetical protein
VTTDTRPAVHDALVARLVDDARPVRLPWTPGRRLVAWVVGGTALTVAIALADGVPNLAHRLTEPLFAAQLASLGMAAGWCALLALRAGVPGRAPSAGALVLAAGLTTTAVALTLAHAAVPVDDAGAFIQIGLSCAGSCLLVGALPWLVLMALLRRGAPLAPGRAGALAGAAALLLAAAATRTACPLGDGRWHFLVWHVAPVALAAALSAAAAARWLRHWRTPSTLRPA